MGTTMGTGNVHNDDAETLQFADESDWMDEGAEDDVAETKTLGEMTADDRAAAVRRAATKFQAELDRTAPIIGKALSGDDESCDGGQWCRCPGSTPCYPATSAEQGEALIATTPVLNETVTHVPDYDGHWKGEAYLTHHTYGVQVHRHSDEAERWNAMQRKLRPA